MTAGGYARSMPIQQLLAEACGLKVNLPGSATGLSIDSRRIIPGDIFFSLSRDVAQRRQHVASARKAGASAVLVDADLPDVLLESFDVHAIPGLGKRLGAIASRFYGDPARHLTITGVTGTNGKTSVTHFLAQLISSVTRSPAAIIGTLGYGRPEALRPLNMTTPDPVRLHEIFSELVAQDLHQVSMEVSSHGLAQGRVAGVPFATAILTNLTRDHLDYHCDMQSYAAAKRLLFHMQGLQTAILNLEDSFGRELLAEIPSTVRCIGYVTRPLNKTSCRQLEAVIEGHCFNADREGLDLHISGSFGNGQVRTSLIGGFNVHNLLAAAGAALAQGMSLGSVLEGLSQVRPVRGRMERFGGPHQPLIVVDFAHTPDGLQQALSSLRAICKGRLICVFGCGGNRDSGKRPLMGAIAEDLADQLILTSDNPRSEDPHSILRDIASGMQRAGSVLTEIDRAHAIQKAIAAAAPQDVVLIAGKGHEDYQEGADGRVPFSDKEVVQYCLGVSHP